MYDFLMGDVPDLGEVVKELDANNCTIVSSFYISDSQQFVILYEKPEEKQKIGFLRKEDE